MTKHLPRARFAAASIAGASALLLAVPTAPAATPPPTVLDTGRVLELASDGRAVAWLHADDGPNGGRPTAISLWTWDGTGAARKIEQPLPSNASEVALGADAAGRRTIVLVADGTTRTGSKTLYALPADGSAPPRRLRASLPDGAESAPGLRDGVLSFTRREKLRANGKVRATVRVGSLTSSLSRLGWRGARATDIESTVPTARNGVAFVTSRAVGDGCAFALRVLRVGEPSILLSRTSFGGASAAGFGPLVATDHGERLTATRWVDDGGGHPADRTRYEVPAGKRIGRPGRLAPGEMDTGVPIAGGTVFVEEYVAKGEASGHLLFRPAE